MSADMDGREDLQAAVKRARGAYLGALRVGADDIAALAVELARVESLAWYERRARDGAAVQ